MKTSQRETLSGSALVLISLSPMVAVGVIGVALLAASSASRQQRLYFDIGSRAQYAAESGRSYTYARRAGNIHYVPAGTFALTTGDRFALSTLRDGSNLVVTATGIAHPATPREAHRAVRFVLDYNPIIVLEDVFLWCGG
jgi:hypothetical protein